MENETLANILRVLQPDIIVSNKGEPSFGETTGLTMRAFATVKGLHSVTMEYGNPQVYQTDMVERGVRGIFDVLTFLDFIEGNITLPEPQNICSKSYWIYTDKGGYLEIFVQLNQKVTHGERLAVLKNAFGEIIDTYYIPEDGIVIGKSTNPVNSSGGRIIHLGILANR
jgi:predicted deacylase